MKANGRTHQLWSVIMLLNYLAKTKIPRRETRGILVASRELGILGVNVEETKYIFMSR